MYSDWVEGMILLVHIARIARLVRHFSAEGTSLFEVRSIRPGGLPSFLSKVVD